MAERVRVRVREIDDDEGYKDGRPRTFTLTRHSL